MTEHAERPCSVERDVPRKPQPRVARAYDLVASHQPKSDSRTHRDHAEIVQPPTLAEPVFCRGQCDDVVVDGSVDP